MSLITRLVRVNLDSADSVALAGVTVEATLTVPEVDGLMVVPTSISGVTDSNGSCLLNLWPNERGVNGSQYRIKARQQSGTLILSTLCTVPDGDVLVEVPLYTIITDPPYPAVDAALQAVINAQAQADLAATSAGAAATSATGSATSATAAATSATNAAASATAAAGSATTASTQATNAANSATTATTQATAAATSATAAAGSATTAGTHATNAAASATTASTQATNAATSATNAANSATSAGTQAGIATTQAALATTNGAAQVSSAAAQVALANSAQVASAASAAAAAAAQTAAQGYATTALATNPDAPVRLNPRYITTSLTIASAYNAASVGPITIISGATVTISDNATWSIH